MKDIPSDKPPMSPTEHNLIQTLYLLVLKFGQNGVLIVPDVEQMAPMLTNRVGIGIMIAGADLIVTITERPDDSVN